MRIQLINPNTTESMTETIAAAGRAAAAPGTVIQPVTAATGPVSIEGHYEEAVAAIAVLEAVRAGEEAGVAAHVIACFGDPGLLAAREIARGPVIGIAEAAMHLASLIATGFSVVTTLTRTRIIAEHLVLAYGMERNCRRVRATDLPVLGLADPGLDARGVIAAECRRALAEDGSGAIVLGCAGMADLAADLSAEFGVPVIDGVGAAVKLAEALVALGLATSKRGDLAPPGLKPYRGFLAHMAPRPADASPPAPAEARTMTRDPALARPDAA
ncbi:MAG TPA: aspartate/glutamate racemase family protein [Acetobacteraceae bacterium]|nr:aspartate/glutamate racemase family protein [Acetobacteraceae bacterium]